MRIWGFIRSLNWRQLFRLLALCLVNLKRVWPTWRATKKSVSLANTHYGSAHQHNTAANAFRHALWNYLVADACSTDKMDLEDTLIWTKQITGIHEELFPNPPLARAMDLHNNAVGRIIYKEYGPGKSGEILRLLKVKTGESELIETLEDLSKIKAGKLVHIINNESNER